MMLAYTDSTHWYSDSHTIRALLRLLEYPLAFVIGSITLWWHKRKQKIALDWPVVEGCVQFAHVNADGNSVYTGTLDYSYYVGEYRSGSYSRDFTSSDAADEFIKTMKDKKIPIHYDPSNPDQSVLEDTDVEQQAQLSPA